jgi:hypothetical protein
MNAVLNGQFNVLCAIQPSISYSFHLTPGKLGHSMILAREQAIPALGFPVSHILFVIPKPQMLRVNASRVVTGMANKHSFWDLAEVNLV